MGVVFATIKWLSSLCVWCFVDDAAVYEISLLCISLFYGLRIMCCVWFISGVDSVWAVVVLMLMLCVVQFRLFDCYGGILIYVSSTNLVVLDGCLWIVWSVMHQFRRDFHLCVFGGIANFVLLVSSGFHVLVVTNMIHYVSYFPRTLVAYVFVWAFKNTLGNFGWYGLWLMVVVCRVLLAIDLGVVVYGNICGCVGVRMFSFRSAFFSSCITYYMLLILDNCLEILKSWNDSLLVFMWYKCKFSCGVCFGLGCFLHLLFKIVRSLWGCSQGYVRKVLWSVCRFRYAVYYFDAVLSFYNYYIVLIDVLLIGRFPWVYAGVSYDLCIVGIGFEFIGGRLLVIDYTTFYLIVLLTHMVAFRYYWFPIVFVCLRVVVVPLFGLGCFVVTYLLDYIALGFILPTIFINGLLFVFRLLVIILAAEMKPACCVDCFCVLLGVGCLFIEYVLFLLGYVWMLLGCYAMLEFMSMGCIICLLLCGLVSDILCVVVIRVGLVGRLYVMLNILLKSVCFTRLAQACVYCVECSVNGAGDLGMTSLIGLLCIYCNCNGFSDDFFDICPDGWWCLLVVRILYLDQVSIAYFFLGLVATCCGLHAGYVRCFGLVGVVCCGFLL
eukprot:gene3161-2143_t